MKHLLIIFSLLLTSVSWSEDVDSNDSLDQTEEVMEEQNNYKQIPDISTQPLITNQANQITAQTQTLPIPMPLPQVAAPSVLTPQLGNNPGIAPLPPTGLPNGWTMEQWEHYGWKYMESFRK